VELAGHLDRGSGTEAPTIFFLAGYLNFRSLKTTTKNRQTVNKQPPIFFTTQNPPPHGPQFSDQTAAPLHESIDIRQSSRHVELLLTWRDDRRLLFFLYLISEGSSKIISVINESLSLKRMGNAPLAPKGGLPHCGGCRDDDNVDARCDEPANDRRPDDSHRDDNAIKDDADDVDNEDARCRVDENDDVNNATRHDNQQIGVKRGRGTG
jgi:hypothetical protein